jgi:hypothetical protein
MRIKKREIQEKITPQEVQRQIGDIVDATQQALGDDTDEETAQEFLKAVVSSDLNEVVNSDYLVQFDSERTDETPFYINGIKWQYVNAIYPDGKKDIAVYRFDHDLTYDFDWFMSEVVPQPADNLTEVADKDVHTAKFDRCVKAVEKKGDVDNPYAVCQASIGADAIKKSHRRKEDDEYVKTEEVYGGTGEDFGDIPTGKDIEAGESDYEEYQDLLKAMAKDSSGIDYDEKPTDDLPFESVKPKMSKNDLIESVVGKKTRRVLKTIKVNELKNK